MNAKTAGLITFGLVVAAWLGTAAAAAAPSADPVAALVDEARQLLRGRPATRQSEQSLEQIVLAIGRHPPAADARRLLQELTSRAPAVRVRHEEGPVLIPLVDVAATARFVLRDWRRSAARAQANDALRAGHGDFVNRYLDAEPPEQAGMLDAVRAADAGRLALYRDALAGRIDARPAGPLAGAVGLALADTRLLGAVVARGEPRAALDVLPELEARLGPAAALDVLRGALARPAIASAALFEIARLQATLPAATATLWERLADPDLGGSAAAALARDADELTRERLRALATDSADALLQQRARLALRLAAAAAAGPAATRPAPGTR